MSKVTQRYLETSSSPYTKNAHDKRRSYRGRGLVRRRAKFTAGLGIIGAFYVVAVFADFLAPYDYRMQFRRESLARPTIIHFRDARNGL